MKTHIFRKYFIYLLFATPLFFVFCNEDGIDPFSLPQISTSTASTTTGIINSTTTELTTSTAKITSSSTEDYFGNGWIGHGYDGWMTIDHKDGFNDIYNPTKTLGETDSVFVYNDHIYIGETNGNGRIVKWTTTGIFVGWIGGCQRGWQTDYNLVSSSLPHGMLIRYDYICNPIDISIYDDMIYYSNQNTQIHRWTIDGEPKGWIGGGTDGWKTTSEWYPYGVDCKSFGDVWGIDIDPDGNLYVCNTFNETTMTSSWYCSRISRWTLEGTATGWIGGDSHGWKTVDFDMSSYTEENYDDLTYFIGRDVEIGNDNYIYISSYKPSRVCRWTLDGTATGWIGGGTDGWKTTEGPSAPPDGDYRNFSLDIEGLFVDNDSIYISDIYSRRTCRWLKDGTAMGWIGHGFTTWQTTNSDNTPDHNTDHYLYSGSTGLFKTDGGYKKISYLYMTGDIVSRWLLN